MEEITISEWLVFLLALGPLILFAWGLIIIALIKLFKGEW